MTRTPATANEILGRMLGAVARIDQARLQAIFSPGHYKAVTDMAGSTFGGRASFGGVTKYT